MYILLRIIKKSNQEYNMFLTHPVTLVSFIFNKLSLGSTQLEDVDVDVVFYFILLSKVQFCWQDDFFKDPKNDINIV